MDYLDYFNRSWIVFDSFNFNLIRIFAFSLRPFRILNEESTPNLFNRFLNQINFPKFRATTGSLLWDSILLTINGFPVTSGNRVSFRSLSISPVEINR